MMILGNKLLISLRILTAILSILSFLGLIIVVSVSGVKILGDNSIIQGIHILSSGTISINQLHWIALGLLLIATLVTFVFSMWVGYLIKPIPQSLYTRINTMARRIIEVKQAMDAIAKVRPYATRFELKALMKQYKEKVKQKIYQLSQVDRYPNGERLWPDLDYL